MSSRKLFTSDVARASTDFCVDANSSSAFRSAATSVVLTNSTCRLPKTAIELAIFSRSSELAKDDLLDLLSDAWALFNFATLASSLVISLLSVAVFRTFSVSADTDSATALISCVTRVSPFLASASALVVHSTRSSSNARSASRTTRSADLRPSSRFL